MVDVQMSALPPKADMCGALGMSALCHVWTYMDPARLQQVGGIRFNGHNC